jgi:hypothetical protein
LLITFKFFFWKSLLCLASSKSFSIYSLSNLTLVASTNSKSSFISIFPPSRPMGTVTLVGYSYSTGSWAIAIILNKLLVKKKKKKNNQKKKKEIFKFINSINFKNSKSSRKKKKNQI